MFTVQKFAVLGLFDSYDVELPFSGISKIIVGPNGIGKSTVSNIFYYFISRQWNRILEYKFRSIVFVLNNKEYIISREDFSGLSSVSDILASARPSSRIHSNVEALIAADAFEEFISGGPIQRKSSVARKYARIMGMPVEEVSHFRRYLRDRFGHEETLFNKVTRDLSKELSTLIDSRILFLPTYRRIERDLQVVFPDFEEKFRRYVGEGLEPGRSTSHYVELVSFGMEDVRSNLDATLANLRAHSLAQYNSLSASYLRDVIRGEGDKFNAREINALSEDDISDILNKVDEKSLPIEDKNLLRKQIRAIQGKKKKDLIIQEKYLAHYFSRLVSITSDLKIRDEDVRGFESVCNKYLSPGKYISYDDINYQVNIFDKSGKPIDLSDLSSGEKQIISIFAHIYFDDAKNHIVIIDEPELSLSVPWQKTFLPDILNSGHCSFLLSVTHSPFIYDNELSESATDLRKHIKWVK